MTCVVALKHEGIVHMGCDSAGVGGYSRANRVDPKIYRVGDMLIGFTTSFRMGQLLGYSLTLPRHHADVPVENYMATVFINAVRDCLKAGGWHRRKRRTRSAANSLLGIAAAFSRLRATTKSANARSRIAPSDADSI